MDKTVELINTIKVKESIISKYNADIKVLYQNLTHELAESKNIITDSIQQIYKDLDRTFKYKADAEAIVRSLKDSVLKLLIGD